MSNITKSSLGTLALGEQIVTNVEISNFLDKQEGGTVLGSVTLLSHDMNILSGNFI